MMDTPKRRHDPDRRMRIIDATLDVIAEHGVAGASHRRIAASADVPLGSMTYHFAGIDELLAAAFTRFTDTLSGRYADRLSDAMSLDEAREVVTELIWDDVWTSHRNMVLSYELYAYAARTASVQPVTERWMLNNRSSLAAHFGERAAIALDAFIEGVTIQNANAPLHAMSKDHVRQVVSALTVPD